VCLQGIEDERMVHTKGTKKSIASRGKDKQDDGKLESDESESIGAPSTRSVTFLKAMLAAACEHSNTFLKSFIMWIPEGRF